MITRSVHHYERCFTGLNYRVSVRVTIGFVASTKMCVTYELSKRELANFRTPKIYVTDNSGFSVSLCGTQIPRSVKYKLIVLGRLGCWKTVWAYKSRVYRIIVQYILHFSSPFENSALVSMKSTQSSRTTINRSSFSLNWQSIFTQDYTRLIERQK